MTEKTKKPKNCQNCGKPIDSGLFCSETCGYAYHREPQGAKPFDVENLQNSNLVLDVELRSKLNNAGWQRGLSWRTEKIEAIAEARRRGVSEGEVFKQLKRAGLIDQTVKALMHDAHYFDE